MDHKTASAVGIALPLAEQSDNERWRGLVEKHILRRHAKNIPAFHTDSVIPLKVSCLDFKSGSSKK